MTYKLLLIYCLAKFIVFYIRGAKYVGPANSKLCKAIKYASIIPYNPFTSEFYGFPVKGKQ